MSYSEVFKNNLEQEVIAFVKWLPKQGIWKKDVPVEAKIEAVEIFLKNLSDFYGVSTPSFVFSDSESGYRWSGGGIYSRDIQEICLYTKFSLVTLLHEFRHHLQYTSDIEIYKENREEDARAWSVSLFRAACPKSYENSVRKGILHFT